MENNKTEKPKVQHVQVPDPSGCNDLKPTDKLVYANIRRFMNKDTYTCYPSMSTIANKCGVTVQTVQHSIKRLVKWGYLEILPEKHNSKNNIYKFPKLSEDFERFTDAFLDNPELTSSEKAYLIGLQSQCYKDGDYALTTYTNTEIADILNISTKSVSRFNTSLETKQVMTELRTVKNDEEGFNKLVKAIDLAKIGQKILFEVAVDHEDRIRSLEKTVELLIKENRELKKQLHPEIPTSFPME